MKTVSEVLQSNKDFDVSIQCFYFPLLQSINGAECLSVSLPYKTSNVPNKMFYTTIAGECLIICWSTSDLMPAITSIKALFYGMKLQGAVKTKLNK